MKIEQRQLVLDSGHILYGFEKISNNSRAMLIFLPGFCQTKTGSYFMFMELLKNYKTLNGISFDYRGHGESTGDLVDVKYTTLLEDGKHIIEYAFEKKLKNKIFLVGSGIGGSIALELAENSNIDGVILIGPYLKYKDELKDFVDQDTYIQFKKDNVIDTNDLGNWDESINLNEYFLQLGQHANRVRGQLISYDFFESLNQIKSLKVLQRLQKPVKIFVGDYIPEFLSLSDERIEQIEGADLLFSHPQWRDYIYQSINKWVDNAI
ncbi:MAG: alpha/beta fold hydrolase [Halanaerobiales bacterium]|nr:alpha/beta fold hydrolase [Halanaerobiales bacterium]